MPSDEKTEKLLIEYQPYIHSIVKRFKVSKFDEEDLYQAGLVGLFKAIKHYDENYAVKLSTYAFKYILGEVSKEYAKLNLYGKKKYNQIRSYVSKNCDKTTDELINELRITKETFFEAISKVDKIIYLDDDLVDSIKDSNFVLDYDLTSEEELLWRYYVHYKLNQAEIAKKMGTSQATISRKLKKVALKIKGEA